MMSTEQEEPLFINATNTRLMLSTEGRATFWLDPGKTVKGKRYRAFIPIGLKEVKKEPFLPAPKPPQAAAKVSLEQLLAKAAPKVEAVKPAQKTSQQKRDGEPTISKALPSDDEISTPIVSDPTNFPFACDAEGCTERFGSASGLKNHKRRHASS